MSPRITTGSFGGRRLDSLEGSGTRPTADRIKQAIFNMIQFEVEGRTVLDLFAGSGQMGLEALSRGAKHCTFVDSSRAAARIIARNVELCGAGDRAEIKTISADRFLEQSGSEKFDLIFIDPPYGGNLVEESLTALVELNMLPRGAIVVCESKRGDRTPEGVSELTRTRQIVHGDIKIEKYEL